MNTSELLCILKEMNITDSYISFSKEYQSPIKELFRNYDNSEVLNIIRNLGYDGKYIKSENFFKISYPKCNDFKFQLNLGLKSGIVDIIFCVWYRDTLLTGTALGLLLDDVNGREIETIKPLFKNYDELSQILKYTLDLFDDLKNRVIEKA